MAYEGRNQDRKEFNVVGKWGIPGRQSYAMAAGLAKYANDIIVPDMLFGKVLRSPYAHARIKSMDISKAQALPGVKAVVTWEDPEIKAMPNLSITWGVGTLAWGASSVLSNIADREGDEVGVIVAAESEEICDEALKLIKVEWEILPHILDQMEAIKPDAPILNPDLDPKTNIGREENWAHGDVEAGFKEADRTLEYDLSWAHVCHHRPNPLVAVAWWEDNHYGTEGKTLVTDTPHHIQRIGASQTARVTQNLPEDKVHVLTPYWGGKYCGFIPRRGEAYAPLLAKRTGRPVRVESTRRDDFDIGYLTNNVHVKIGFKNDGTLTAADGKFIADIGTRSTSANEYVGSMAGFETTKCHNIKQELKYVYTNTMRHRTFQNGPGYEISAKAFYLIADALGMDPTEVALKNCHTPEPSLKQCIEAGKKAIGWTWHATGAKKLPNGKMHGYGFRYHHERHSGAVTYVATLALKTDGKVYMPHNEALAYTYWADACAMVIAEELGAKIEDVIVHFVPDLQTWLQGTAMDRGPSSCFAAKEAAIDLKAKLLATAAAALKVKPEELDTKDSTVYLKADPTKSYPFKQFADIGASPLAACFIGRPFGHDAPRVLKTMNALFCEVEVDTETGKVEITKWVAACDAGKVIRPSSYVGQTEQMLMYDTAWALWEEVIYDKTTGVKLNASSLEYGPPTTLDVPPMEHPTLETRIAGGCYGATGHSHSIADKAIVSLAVYNAIGKWIDNPITPDKVLKALGKI